MLLIRPVPFGVPLADDIVISDDEHSLGILSRQRFRQIIKLLTGETLTLGPDSLPIEFSPRTRSCDAYAQTGDNNVTQKTGAI